MKCSWMVLAAVLIAAPANGAVKDARPLGTLLEAGGKVIAASGEMVWVELGPDTYMCVIEMNNRFRQALKFRKVRELYAN